MNIVNLISFSVIDCVFQTTFELPPSAQSLPAFLIPGGDPNLVYLVVNDLGTNSGQGFDFVNGQGFLYVSPFYFDLHLKNSLPGNISTPYSTSETTNWVSALIPRS